MAAGHEGPHAWGTEASPARRGIDRLLATLPHRELEFLAADAGDLAFLQAAHPRGAGEFAALETPWVVIQFVGGDRYAIWKRTGAVYRIGPDGAVDEDPILELERSSSERSEG
jgi:hypothetical protein